ncbi:Dolichyl-diphosphooligosaccharide--protein glycosyltransferase subunit 1 [Colletotrichum siamense]|uniref:Dolichyl-diphosphooligosaccharide--protein glycosyltransferase subunit 1 n=1 Tax=Colletotrichum siamense TaxID=690259 RepID=A0A9P5EQW7_COLSI|nr:Dolichyl-diphosphooligosaccharide--protein glycosyltransferase subunit 1 [Colletotrichum siamense]KAF4842743.1 Dolichyl-diphosphooligosaccharide--protein glycosyltransferase subunit 1 [Colletotrichum siamense]KAF4858124.1 Dolichyl-diphosphooligosaccharide--protein glycosyltransferase subunit 1 [Colletotrichum siamense]KAF5516372.1 Dolichyl-diphosphooligosaccharide--protein glycosyltransferase subunit 1 [Colletotrichum siamense]
MRAFAIAAGLLSLLSPVVASSAAADKSEVNQPSTFKPPQVFKNANLVHIISLEKNYVKESINVLIENIDKQPQDEYYLPFTPDQMSRVGGFEAKDRKDPEAGPFAVDAVEFDPSSEIQYYKIKLPAPLKAGGQQTLSISYYLLKAYKPLPAAIAQEENQFLAYDFSVYAPSAYVTTKQKTELKSHSSNIPDYTKLPGSGDIKEFPQKAGSKLTYGPFDEKPAGAVSKAQVRFEFTKPVTHVSKLDRDIEVSHWGGNVAFEERYELYHRGANLSKLFNRVKWQQSQYFNPNTYALKELRFPLKVGSADAYFTDAIGNVSTSRFRSNKREALLEIKPRYPVFGGWKYPFTIGWNSDAKNFVRTVEAGKYVVNVPFLEGPKQPEGIEYGQVNLRILLPEGATNVKFYTSIPQSAIAESAVGVHQTYLDTVGRTSVTLKAQNLVDEFRDREVIVTYDYSVASALRKPLIVFASMVFVFVAAWVVGGLNPTIAKKK